MPFAAGAGPQARAEINFIDQAIADLMERRAVLVDLAERYDAEFDAEFGVAARVVEPNPQEDLAAAGRAEFERLRELGEL